MIDKKLKAIVIVFAVFCIILMLFDSMVLLFKKEFNSGFDNGALVSGGVDKSALDKYVRLDYNTQVNNNCYISDMYLVSYSDQKFIRFRVTTKDLFLKDLYEMRAYCTAELRDGSKVPGMLASFPEKIMGMVCMEFILVMNSDDLLSLADSEIIFDVLCKNDIGSEIYADAKLIVPIGNYVVDEQSLYE